MGAQRPSRSGAAGTGVGLRQSRCRGTKPNLPGGHMNSTQSSRRHSPGERSGVVFGLAFALLYLFVITYHPLTLLADAALDDGIFIVQGRSLTEGRWLGSFNWLTLRTGPGYPLFLGVNLWLGLPITFVHVMFFCGAVGLFSWAVKSVSRSGLIGLSTFVLILWHPVFLGTQAIRDTIYTGQLFLVFACALAGLWDRWKNPETGESVISCTIIVTGANALTRPIHDRAAASEFLVLLFLKGKIEMRDLTVAVRKHVI